ncbi:MAG: ABC transporter ATP-binding protein [Nitrospirota bacterium]
MSVVIKVENLSKSYTISHKSNERYVALRDVIANKAKGLFNRGIVQPFKRLSNSTIPQLPNSTVTHPSSNSTATQFPSSTEEFWALKDIHFEVKRGDRVGIIGRNGAGKSTLLKVLSRITEPTKGRIEITGRVASLLEVGTGFHPELTGRENIFLNGAILGMTRAEIKKKFDEIVDFAEIEKFLDTPVKRYSSGMYVRLAFAVAAHLEPEILIVDEVLAVGDAQFQKKCLGKMEEVGKEGRTVLFVSHNMSAIRSLCSTALMLNCGSIVEIGRTNFVIDKYLNTIESTHLENTWNNIATSPGNEYIRLKSVRIIPEIKSQNDNITVATPIAIRFEFWNLVPNSFINLSLVLWTASGECVFNVGSKSLKLKKGIYCSTCSIPGNFLNDGTYSVEIYFVKDSSLVLFKKSQVAFFQVHDIERYGWYGKWIGAVRPALPFSLEECNEHHI